MEEEKKEKKHHDSVRVITSLYTRKRLFCFLIFS